MNSILEIDIVLLNLRGPFHGVFSKINVRLTDVIKIFTTNYYLLSSYWICVSV